MNKEFRDNIVIEENPSWHLPRQQQLLNILEGVPLKISGIDIRMYNPRTLWLFKSINDINLLDVLTRIKPKQVNLFTDELIEELYRTGRISGESYFVGLNRYMEADVKEYHQMKSVLKTIDMDFRAAQRKYIALNSQADNKDA